ncbi:alpha/beta hydrolase [Sporocytophaga myxococcoides]|uniref:alpha/beta hydrolase n=1 Tax=Sporocytophaga myxococcoides TaxID=153721 RepID=UPI00042222B1|nr:alpha/beta fold hydrolase [Sporocytophaga myxococcoides]
MKKIARILLITFIVFFIFTNFVAIFHSYKFTHFSSEKLAKPKKPEDLTSAEKLKIMILGVKMPKPLNETEPHQKFQTIVLQSNKKIECWSIKNQQSKGTVILFHGYGGKKSSLMDKAEVFIDLGYNVFMVDFMGSGGSEGLQTTIGYKEAENVKTAYDYIKEKGEKDIFLFGTSMGAVAIMKALDKYPLEPKGIILECPFATMFEATSARFKAVGAPVFPMAGLVVFWGGLTNGFWAFDHNPVDYAKKIKCKTLLLYGEQDKRVSREEIDAIYSNLNCSKELKTYPLAGHVNYLLKYKTEWTRDISTFLDQTNKSIYPNH